MTACDLRTALHDDTFHREHRPPEVHGHEAWITIEQRLRIYDYQYHPKRRGTRDIRLVKASFEAVVCQWPVVGCVAVVLVTSEHSPLTCALTCVQETTTEART